LPDVPNTSITVHNTSGRDVGISIEPWGDHRVVAPGEKLVAHSGRVLGEDWTIEVTAVGITLYKEGTYEVALDASTGPSELA
jgi:hypothetical protein